jgi:hypothetical protein
MKKCQYQEFVCYCEICLCCCNLKIRWSDTDHIDTKYALLRGSGVNSLGGGAVEEVPWEVQEKGTTITHAYVKI